LNIYPEKQLSYLEGILDDPKRIINDETKIKFMKLLFKYKPKIILKELFKREFPMDAVLQLCNEY
jgi:hypothetical protein